MLNLRAIRKRKKLSQQDLATLLGVSQIAISQYERGTREPNIETLVLICQKMDITIEELIDFKSIQEKLSKKIR
ncbi:Predicted transcriptional regulator [Alteracholeplasma palmae J233]|uniref:Predicted transcriptional regulator n=1 Tax=Alteracholeplasma palmae (strain ATCC 49389 / J233) TaxID=1318466 RepID=U4KKN6_ALTPJ|nr:Predicted transcriptional regulator [Alteracholeplasma palmae J233]